MQVTIAKPILGEQELSAIKQVLDSGILTNGTAVESFETAVADRHGVAHAVAFANGSLALTALLIAHGISAGDEVIVPSLTFISTATAVLHAGATPVFAEVNVDTLDLDPADVEHRITTKTRAIILVHYGGQPADLPGLTALARHHGLCLLEDAAQAHGATFDGKPVGTWGQGAMLSFTPTKTITTGEGGIALVGEEGIAKRLKLIRNHGMTGEYEYAMLGYNMRLTEIQAAMGLAQLDRLDDILARKSDNWHWLQTRLVASHGFRPPVERPSAKGSHLFFTVVLAATIDRAEIRDRLAHEGIQTKIYYPPVHRSSVFSGQKGSLPITERMTERILTLPSHAGLSRHELEYVVDSFLTLIDKRA